MQTATGLVHGRQARSNLPATLTIATGRHHTAETILRAWREGKAEHTIRSYQHDLQDFALYFSRALGLSPPMDVNGAVGRLFRQASPSAHEIVLGFRHYLATAHLSAASINRHLATLRSVSKLGRMLGMMSWQLEVPGVKAERRRDTRGPDVEDVRRMLAATAGDNEAETRDYAIVVTFYCLGLRVSELCGLTLQETDLDRGVTWIRGKGRREKELIPLPAVVVEALRRYLTHRGPTAGPLFQSRGERGKARNRALETRSVLRIVRELGQRVGLHVWCHGLRHSSITAALDVAAKAGIGLDKVKAHSRHAAIGTLLIYADEHDRQGTQRRLADLVAGTLTTSPPLAVTVGDMLQRIR
ncbi:MAG: tyrosine-type recombinase/integrase [Acidobacteriota bacterium]